MSQFLLGFFIGLALGVVAMALFAVSAPDVKDLRDEIDGLRDELNGKH